MIKTSVDDRPLPPDPVHYGTKHLQQGIESNHFRVKKNMPNRRLLILQNGTADDRELRSHALVEEGLRFFGDWTVNNQNDLLARLFGLPKVNRV
ncbi:hypothetical protein GGE16_000052 [Rhizobium leguminosarum]|uniref:DDE domain family protein n=1 Tax=Rhizobium leguminosarum TaxID=384 RepID=A0AAE2MEU0_RHILE|nr:hypothetical protein [Rhizobium leguminosarum]MBB4431996.1 hypothetical protein [Rhizobium esperanzae]MBB4295873.1 hypothetical protein [Rhizobium leguminosarum]MBB4307265.1 hypothetical protein [Rhizobium leguminosarum]MBB4417152.1 hypothetical protein [Rhizobium leguminosarum]